jgi:hypothetical protein
VTTRQVRLDVLAETRQYQARMAKIPGITDREAAKAAVRFERNLVKAQDRAARAAERAARQSSRAWQQVGSHIAGALTADAIRGAATGVFELVGSVHEARTEIIRLNQATGASTEILGAMETAVATQGQTIQQFRRGLEAFPRVMLDFTRGTGSARDTLEQLGLSASEVEGRLDDTDGLMRDVIGRLQGVDDETRRAAMATQIFAGRGAELMAALDGKTLEEWTELTRAYGNLVDSEATAATLAWNDATADLGGAFSRAADDITNMLDVSDRIREFSVGFVYTWNVLTGSVEVVTDRIGLFFQMMDQASSGDFAGAVTTWAGAWTGYGVEVQGVADVFSDAYEATREYAQATEDIVHTAKRATAAEDDHGDALGKTTRETNKAAAAQKKLNQERAKALAAQAAAQDSLIDTIRDAQSDQMTGHQEIEAALFDELEAIQAVEDALGDSALADMARAEARARAVRDHAALELETREELDAAMGELDQLRLDAEQEIWERRLQWIDAGVAAVQGFSSLAVDLWADQEAAARQNAQTAIDSLDEIQQRREELSAQLGEIQNKEEAAYIQHQLRRLDAAEEANARMAQAQKQAAHEAWKKQKAAAVAAAALDMAAGIARAAAQFPLPPALFIAMGSAALSGGLNLAKVAASKPPQFDTGGIPYAGFSRGPDNFDVTIRQGEQAVGIRNSRAAAELEHENQTGRASSAESRPAMNRGDIVRALGRLMADEVGRGRELGRAMGRGAPRIGVRPVYGGG